MKKEKALQMAEKLIDRIYLAEAERNEMHTVLTTLVERLTNNWELLCSGEQSGLKTALLSEANELLNRINK